MKSLKSILVVVALFFGVMLLVKACSSDKETNEKDFTPANTSTTSESSAPIGAEEAAVVNAASSLRIAGNHDAETGVITYSCENVMLTLAKDSLGNEKVDGSVMVDGFVFNYDEVVSNSISDTIAPATRSKAAYSLRKALETAFTRGQFSRFYNPNGAEKVTLKNDVLTLTLDPFGGHISQAVLADYYNYPEDGEKVNVNMFSNPVPGHAAPFFYRFMLKSAEQQSHSTADLYFTPNVVSDNCVEMTLNFPNGAYWGYRYSFESNDSYVVKMEVIQKDMNLILSPSMTAPEMRIYELMPRQDKSRTFEERNSAIYYKPAGDSPEDVEGESRETVTTNISWVAFKNQFFSTIFIPSSPFSAAKFAQNDLKDNSRYENYVKNMDAYLETPYDPNAEVAVAFDIYIGPNSYPILSDLDDELGLDDMDFTRVIPLGWSWLRWINTLIIIPIFTFLSGFISNYGIIILILTIVIKIILFPFTYKSYLSQAKMRVLAPDIKKINDELPGNENAMARQQKTMQLYREAGASPLSGCLPLLLQMPILIAMFSFFPSCIELRGESFLWVKDLAAPDYICTLPFTIPFYGNHVSLFCLLMTLTNVAYSYINMKSQPTSSSMPGMKWMMYLMPVMFLFFFNDYAAALSYYYFLSLLITIIQTWIFRRCVNEEKVRAKIEENRRKPKKKSGFMARLEEAQRKQQAALREQQNRQRRR